MVGYDEILIEARNEAKDVCAAESVLGLCICTAVAARICFFLLYAFAVFVTVQLQHYKCQCGWPECCVYRVEKLCGRPDRQYEL
ncbi:hypothetical protein D3C81_2092540 [compost metagenome]